MLVITLIVVAFSAVMARLNYFEWMFHPIARAQFLSQAQSKLEAKEMIMSVRLGRDARAYPISQMAYHHILNDVVRECRSRSHIERCVTPVWCGHEPSTDRVLDFYLAGINNQNFLMRDQETGTWWQQITGKAIYGPLQGATLDLVLSDELTFGEWKTEFPRGRGAARPWLEIYERIRQRLGAGSCKTARRHQFSRH